MQKVASQRQVTVCNPQSSRGVERNFTQQDLRAEIHVPISGVREDLELCMLLMTPTLPCPGTYQ